MDLSRLNMSCSWQIKVTLMCTGRIKLIFPHFDHMLYLCTFAWLLLTYGVSIMSKDSGGVMLSPQQLCKWPFDLFVQETLHR